MGIANLVDSIYVVGGDGESDPVGLMQMRYYPLQDSWEVSELATYEFWSKGGLAVVGTRLHILGGLRGELISDSHMAYQAIYLIHMPVIR